MADNAETGITPEMLGEDANDSPIGVYAPFPYSPEPFAQLSEKAKAALTELNQVATKADIAARRLEVEQAWEALHFDRGYQHLLRGKQGGWVLPGNNTGYGAANQQWMSSTYDTNIYGSKGDIIVAALSREVPKQEFFPMDPEYAPDILAAEEANKFKKIWARNNDLHTLLSEVARMFWNEDRVLLWTYYELNGQKYGFEGDEPTTPKAENNPLNEPEVSPEATGQEGQEDVLDAETAPVEADQEGLEESDAEHSKTADAMAEAGGARRPLGREVTRAFGKLDHKVPFTADKDEDMPFVQIYQDLDVSVVRSTFPWMADKIQPQGSTESEVQLDRIARQNVRQAVLGAYVTGDSMNRICTVTYTWLRPSMFADVKVEDDVRAELLQKFPDGVMMAFAGKDMAFARNESVDKHITIGHALTGKGQNRRALGTSMISVQKRINDWVDLMDDFFKNTVPKKWMNSDAFDMNAIKNQPNVPGSIGPFVPQPGLTTSDQYIMVEPTPQPQAALAEFVQWFITALSEEITGALPSLFGARTNTDTVGGIEIQRDQALQRVGSPWNSIQQMFAKAAGQAVECAKECRDGKVVSQIIPGEDKPTTTVNTANLIQGRVLCYPESNPSFPESWAQREEKIMGMIDASTQNPLLAQWIFAPANLPAVRDAVRMKEFKVPGASSITKQKSEFETLLRSGPAPNPQLLQIQSALEQARDGLQQMMAPLEQRHQADVQAGVIDPNTPAPEPPPDVMQKIQQLAQVAQSIPPMISTVPVAQDESENHGVEMGECFEWMNSPEGQKFKNGSKAQRLAFQNVHLHWTEHSAMAKKIAADNAPPEKPPSESLSVAVDKMPANVQAQALAKMGIQASPEEFQALKKEDLQTDLAKKTLPDVLKQGNKGPEPVKSSPSPKE